MQLATARKIQKSRGATRQAIHLLKTYGPDTSEDTTSCLVDTVALVMGISQETVCRYISCIDTFLHVGECEHELQPNNSFMSASASLKKLGGIELALLKR